MANFIASGVIRLSLQHLALNATQNDAATGTPESRPARRRRGVRTTTATP